MKMSLNFVFHFISSTGMNEECFNLFPWLGKCISNIILAYIHEIKRYISFNMTLFVNETTSYIFLYCFIHIMRRFTRMRDFGTKMKENVSSRSNIYKSIVSYKPWTNWGIMSLHHILSIHSHFKQSIGLLYLN